MNIRQVKGFCKLVETMNFSRAAEQMYMSQPAFSRMIESLEAELETRLIERGKPGPRLTEAGETLLPNMRRILDEYNEITEKVHRMSMKKGALTVGILEEGLQGKRAELLREFSRENPEIDIDFVEVSESTAFDAVLERKVTARWSPISRNPCGTGWMVTSWEGCRSVPSSTSRILHLTGTAFLLPN